MDAQSSQVLTPPSKTCSLGNVCLICGFSFIHTFIDSDGKEVTKKYFDKKLKLTYERKTAIINSLEIDVECDGDTGLCLKCYRSVEKLERLRKEIYKLRCTLKHSADNVKETHVHSLPSSKRTMETLMPARCEYFCISVDLVSGNTIVSGTDLGKQFVLGDLCKFIGVNVFASFLNFCRENIRKKEKKIVILKKIPTATKAPTVTPNTLKLVSLLNPTAGTHHLQTNTPVDRCIDEGLKRSIVSSDVAGTVDKILTYDNISSNNCSFQKKGIEAGDNREFLPVKTESELDTTERINQALDDQRKVETDVKREVESEMEYTESKIQALNDHRMADTENSSLPSEPNQNSQKETFNSIEEQEDVTSKNNETIFIKEEPDWEDQGVREGVDIESTLNSSHGSNTESGKESPKSSKSNTENGNDLWEPTKKSINCTEDFWESSECNTESEEDLWEPPKNMTKTKADVIEPSNSLHPPDETEESKDLKETKVYSTGNSIYEIPRPGHLISSHHRENTLLKLEKAREELKNKHEYDKKIGEWEAICNGIPTVNYDSALCKIWKCHCGKTFKSQSEFMQHDKDYHNTALKLCEYCGEFTKRDNYKSHIQRHLPDHEKKYFQCTICKKRYFGRGGLKRHMEFVHNGKTLKCQKCKKEFRGGEALKKHQLNHMNILNHICNYCSKRFVTKDSMQRHMRVHTGERPYECEHCGEKFNHNVSRKNHIKKFHPGHEIKNPARRFSH